MSDTPRTDKVFIDGGDEDGWIMLDHARQLERELANMTRLYECAQNANSYRQLALEALEACRNEEK